MCVVLDAQHLRPRGRGISADGNPGTDVAVFAAQDGGAHEGQRCVHGREAAGVGAVGPVLRHAPSQGLRQPDRQSGGQSARDEHALRGAPRLYAQGLQRPCGSQGREGQAIVRPAAALVGEGAGQPVEASVGKGLDEAAQGHEHAVAAEAHFVAVEAVLLEELLQELILLLPPEHKRVLAQAFGGKAEQKQGQEEAAHDYRIHNSQFIIHN